MVFYIYVVHSRMHLSYISWYTFGIIYYKMIARAMTLIRSCTHALPALNYHYHYIYIYHYICVYIQDAKSLATHTRFPVGSKTQ